MHIIKIWKEGSSGSYDRAAQIKWRHFTIECYWTAFL